MDFENWKKEILFTSNREDDEKEKRFLELVDQVEDCCDYEIAKVLMKTFSDKPDYGTQERVVSTLCNLTREQYIQVILEELPRLINEAFEWAEILIGLEIQKRFDYVIKLLPQQSEIVKESVRMLLRNKDFIKAYPNAKNIKF